MKVIFMGSGEFACHQLTALKENEGIEILGVVTQPKREVGRKKELRGTPVYYLAKEFDLEVFEAANSKQIVEQIDLSVADFVVVADYGVLLKDYVLEAPKIDCINVHGSILPFYRGASPIQSCLLNGDEKTGVTIMRMVKAMDAGAIYKIVEYKIEKDDVAPVLYEKLAKIGGTALVETLYEIMDEDLSPVEQDHESATYCGKISKSDGEISFEKEKARQIWNKFRAYYFWPKIFFVHEGKRFIIHECEFDKNGKLASNQFEYDEDSCVLRVGTMEGDLLISEIQPEGKVKMLSKDFWKGYNELFQ